MDNGHSQSPAVRTARESWAWIVLLRPRAVACALVSLSRPAFSIVFVVSLLMYAAVLVGLKLWKDTLVEEWTNLPATISTTTTATQLTWGEPELRGRSVAEVWREWHETALDGWFGRAELTLLLVLILGPVLIAALAWLNLPFVHGGGSVWSSYKRSFRVTVGVLGPVAMLTLACGVVFIVSEHGALGRRAFFPTLEARFHMFVGISVANWLVVWWLRSAVRGIEPAPPEVALPPRCEGCGYDLTHQPAEGRCSECGLALAASLDPQINRPGSAWARRRTTRNWLTTSGAVLRRPHTFYRALRMRTPASAERGFVERHFVAVACGALAWVATILLVDAWASGVRVWRAEDIVMPAVVALLGTFGCWVGQRAIAAGVVTWWLARGALPDFRWAAKVVAYETTFLWVFCCFWGACFTSFALGGNWISWVLGFRGFFPVGEMFTLLGGTALLAAIWVWRYEIAYRAIRWSNL